VTSTAQAALATLLLAAGTAGAEPASTPERSTAVVQGDLGRTLDLYLSRLEALGYSGGLAVVRGGETVLLKGYGQADREGGVPMRPDSVFNLGSITKPFTAAAILRLQELGKLKTSDAVSRFFDGVPEDKAGITLEHLLTHSSGLESDFGPDYQPTTREEYARRALDSKLRFAPGQGYEYANSGYSLLAAVVEKTTGKDYEAALGELVLKPAGMTETGYKAPRWAPERIAHGYQDGEDWGTILDRIQDPGAPFWALRGNGGLHTTLADMVRWNAALQGDAVLNAASRESYVRPRVAEGPGARSHYAFGWAVEKTPHGTLVQHNGGNGIYVAELLRFVDEGVVIFLASTVAELKATPVVPALTAIVFGEPYDLPPAVAPLSPEALRARVGRYRATSGAELGVRVVDGGLEIAASEPVGFALLAGVPAAERERYERLAAGTADIAGRAFKGDPTGIHEALGGRLGLEQVREQEAELMRDREARLGPYRGYAVVGSVPYGEGRVETVVRVDFEKGSVYNRFLWGPRDGLIGLQAGPEPPGARYVPLSEREFVTFRLGGGGGPRRQVSFEGVGPSAVLVIPGPDGPVRLPRVREVVKPAARFRRGVDAPRRVAFGGYIQALRRL
jgi:CubicO group peptidase (beta-lactamase class C family)